MKRILSLASGVAGGMSLLLANATGVLAQSDYLYDSYDYTYDEDAAEAAAGLFGLGGTMLFLVWCCLIVVGIAFAIFRLLMLIHAIQNAPADQKTLWIILIIFVPFCDWVYFFTKKKEWSKSKAAAPATK